MKKIVCFLMAVMMMAGVVQISSFASEGAFADTCYDSFLGFKPWFNGLPMDTDCNITQPTSDKLPVFVWTIVLNILFDLTEAVGIVAMGFIIYGGYLFITSEGDPSKASKAKKTLTGAVIGLVIAVLATIIVNTIQGVLNV